LGHDRVRDVSLGHGAVEVDEDGDWQVARLEDRRGRDLARGPDMVTPASQAGVGGWVGGAGLTARGPTGAVPGQTPS
jgi:hypothetical protein